MYGKKRYVLITFIIVLCLSLFVVNIKPQVEGKPGPYFTLILKTNSGGVRPDYGNFIKQHCARIGINIDVIIQDWPTFVGELIAFRNFDLCYVAFDYAKHDPDFTRVYNENGSLNLFGYHTDMDYDSNLGTGKNEWYMRQGNLIMPPDSEERIQHYWDWEQYLMDEILPMKPMFAPKRYQAHWSNLQGYNFTTDILQSWGKMSWSGSHYGQLATDEVVISMEQWRDLNPLFQDDPESSFITSAAMDSLVWFDNDNTVWPHLAKNWTHLNDTHVRLTLREGVKWQTDPDGLFTDEYFDAEDLYFNFYVLKYLSSDQVLLDWVKEMNIVDKYTFDIFIDGDPDTFENEPYSPYLHALNLRMLPEHYLNQTQDVTGGRPDVTHESWNTFATNVFGTGLFELISNDKDIETILNVFPDCWWFNSTITNDPALNWIARFGDFAGDLDQLRVRHIGDLYETLVEFELGRVDITNLGSDKNKREQFEANSDFTVQNEIAHYLSFIGYNMRPVRPVIGSYDPWHIDPSISKGLAIRKAISYAINREEINQVIHHGEYILIDHPIYATLGVWCNPNIIKYDFDLNKALYYMGDVSGQSSNVVGINLYPLFILSEIVLCMIYLLRRKRS